MTLPQTNRSRDHPLSYCLWIKQNLLDVVVIAAGHSGYRDVQQLESAHKSALMTTFVKLKSANVNVIGMGPCCTRTVLSRV